MLIFSYFKRKITIKPIYTIIKRGMKKSSDSLVKATEILSKQSPVLGQTHNISPTSSTPPSPAIATKNLKDEQPDLHLTQQTTVANPINSESSLKTQHPTIPKNFESIVDTVTKNRPDLDPHPSQQKSSSEKKELVFTTYKTEKPSCNPETEAKIRNMAHSIYSTNSQNNTAFTKPLDSKEYFLQKNKTTNTSSTPIVSIKPIDNTNNTQTKISHIHSIYDDKIPFVANFNEISANTLKQKLHVNETIKNFVAEEGKNLVPSDLVLLREANKKGLIIYDSVSKKDTLINKNVAEVKLTPLGHQGYIVTNPIVKIERSTKIDLEKCSYELGLLNIDPVTLIPLPSQIHIFVIILLDPVNNTREAVGLLTSEATTSNNKNVKISDIQLKDYLDNSNKDNNENRKAQYVKPLSIPRKIEPNQYISFLGGNEYIEQVEFKENLHKVTEIITEYEAIPYNPIGLTREGLLKIIEWESQRILPKLKNKSHNEIDKDKIKSEKAELNRQKQKAAAEEAKHSKEEDIYENTKD